MLTVELSLPFLILTGFRNEGQNIEDFTLGVLVVTRIGQPLLATVRCRRISLEWHPLEHVVVELLVVLCIQLQLIVGGQDDPETMIVFRVALGGVVERLVVLEQQLGRTQVAGAVYVDHQQVEPCFSVLLVAVAAFEVMVDPVHVGCLGQNVQLVERCMFVDIARRHVAAVANDHLRQIGFLEAFTTQELDTVVERLLDDDVVLVAVGCGQRQHLLLLVRGTFVEGEVFNQISLSDFLAYCCQVLGQLHVWTIAAEHPFECVSGFLGQLDGVVQVSDGQLRRVIHKRIRTCQLESLEVTVAHLSLTYFFVLRQQLSLLLAFQLVLDQFQCGVLTHHQTLVSIDDVSQSFQLVRKVHQKLTVLLTGLHVEDLLRRHGQVLGRTLEIAEQAATCIAGIQHGVQLLLSCSTVEQLGRSTEQHHVGRGLPTDFLEARVVRGAFDQLGFHLAFVIQLKECGQYLGVAYEVQTDLIDLQVHRACISHQQLVTHLLHGRGGARVEAEEQGTQTLELLLYPDQFFIRIRVLTDSSLVGQLGQVLFGHQREGFFEETLPEKVNHLILDDGSRVTFACTGRRQVQGIDVDRDIPSIQCCDRATHLGSHYTEVVTHEHSEKEWFGVLCSVTQ